MSIANLIRRMTDAGAPPEAIAIAVEEIEAIQESLDARRHADRDRKRAQREAQKSANVTGHSETSPGQVTPNLSLDKKPPQTPSKNKPNLAPLNPPKFISAWNAMADEHGLPKVDGIGGKRLAALKARTAEHGEDAVLRAIASVPTSPHWLGANGWLGNFDSLMRPDNFQRMIEGTYGPAEPKRAATEPIPLYRQINQAADRRQSAGAHQ